MSKDKAGTGPNSPSKVDVQHTVDATDTLSRGITALVPMTKSQKGLSKILADDNARGVLTRTMSAFIQIDMKFEQGMRSMGEILSNLLGMPAELQTRAIAAICESQGIPPIEETGRKGFAMALYARYPDMLSINGKNKDTRAGMRISSYIAAYKLSKGPKLVKAGSDPKDPSQSANPRSASDLFLRLYTSATNKEQATLVGLAGRAGIEYEDWLPEEDEVAKD